MTDPCEVSVVIPVFNRPELLDKVLEGLCNQHFEQFETLVCDDGSTDDLSGVIQAYSKRLAGLQHLVQENKGPAAARNLGTRSASGKYVLYLDSDILLPDKDLIHKLWRVLEQDQACIGVEARVEPFGGVDNILWDAPSSGVGGVYLTAAILYRLNLIQSIGGFDESFKRAACEDVDLAVRALKHGSIAFQGDALVQHPRRMKTAGFHWRKRDDWRYMKIMAVRYGFVGWPENRSRFPRTRLVVGALVTLPAGRLLSAAQLLVSSPVSGFVGIGHAFVCFAAGLSALPEICFGTVPPMKDYLEDG